jgi:hypothetical protein
MNDVSRAVVLAILLVFLFGMAKNIFAADLAVPRARPVSAVPLPKSKPALEDCLKAGNEPSPGQFLMPDQTCPTGMRWTNPK